MTLGCEKQSGIACEEVVDVIKSVNQVAQQMSDLIPGNPLDQRIAFAILLGQVEGKLRPASKIAMYAGLPRSTVARRIAAMQKANLVVLTKTNGDRALPTLPDQLATKMLRIVSKLRGSRQ
jgi:hypothetical protein